MSTRAPKIWGRIGCTRLTHSKYCDEHRREHDWARSSPGDRSRSRNIPAAQRARVLQRDGRRCQAPDCNAPASHVDHINNQSGDESDGALQSLCGPHHLRKSSAEGLAARGFGTNPSQHDGPVRPRPPQPRRRSSSSRSGEVQASEIRLSPIVMKYN